MSKKSPKLRSLYPDGVPSSKPGEAPPTPPGSSVDDPTKPSLSLLIKLGSVIVHLEEKNSAKGHWMDEFALRAVRDDPEVVAWLAQMTKLQFLPVKR